MRKLLVFMILPFALLAINGCDDDDNSVAVLDEPPQAPQGVFSITGDEEVIIVWNGLYEDDIVEYVVGWNNELFGEYSEVGRVSASPRPDNNLYSFVDTDVDNGVTYFYAVWAIDAGGNASEPSYEIVFDTPRPEGNVQLFSRYFDAIHSGFAFSNLSVVPWDASTADVYIDHDTLFFINGPVEDTVLVLFVNAADVLTDIQDMGFHESFDEVGWAPIVGWSDVRRFELIPGHIYVIWTWDERYAKMRVESISRETGWVNLRWAYQPIGPEDTLANRELTPPPPPQDESGVTSAAAER